MISNTHQTTEAALVTAIIMQAYRDLFARVSDTTTSLTTQTDQDQAIAFMTDDFGKWAQHRNHLCSLIGWDGDVLAARVRRMMLGGAFPDPNASANAAVLASHTDAVERVRARYIHLRTPRSHAA
ncbi:hypothetical protein [Thioclava sp.]|uniref:hypothetical protein n=1 Tax=Thioclava sp. TaxID=1933450 RepID=UPI003AA89F86